MSTLYVIEPGARLEKEYHRLVVVKDDEIIQRVILAKVSEVVLVGAAGVTTPAMIALLQAGVPMAIIRTSGEYRVSNFLLYQLAYSEIYITDTLWPDFREPELRKALLDFQGRERRFGKTREQLENGQ